MEEDKMEMRFGKYSVRENLQRAVEAGKLMVLPDGNYVLTERKKPHNYLRIKSVRTMDCLFFNDCFLNGFLFDHAYEKKAVPFGCSNCYKVKIVPENFRSLIALREVLESSPYTSKCGLHSGDIYAGFLYLEGLAEARTACLDMRARCNAHPELGRTEITIKRGCSNMEAVCGPSDRWLFREGMQELEVYLKAHVQLKTLPVESYPVRKLKSLAIWIQLAYSIKDDSYLSFTNGIPLHKPSVSYSVEEPINDNIASNI